jgi:hypothetical protein
MTRAVTRAASGRNGEFTAGFMVSDLMAGGGSRADCLAAWQRRGGMGDWRRARGWLSGEPFSIY